MNDNKHEQNEQEQTFRKCGERIRKLKEND